MDRNLRWIEEIAGPALIVGIVIGCWLVLRPFVSAILWAAIVCLATWPVRQLLIRWLHGRRTLVAGLMTLILSLAILIPFIIVALTFPQSIQSALKWLESQVPAGVPSPPPWVERIPWVGASLRDQWVAVSEGATPALNRLIPWSQAGANWLLGRTFGMVTGVLHLAMSVLITFFLYRDGSGTVRHVRDALQEISGDTAQHMIDVVGTTVRGVVYGVFGTAIIQAILAGAGFAIAGVSDPVLLALFTFFLALLPFGSPLIWIGASVWLFAMGRTGWGVFMVVYGLLIISGADHVVRPFLISHGSKLPFVIVFIGALGGIAAFGFIGLFIGPTLLAVGYSMANEILTPRSQSAE